MGKNLALPTLSAQSRDECANKCWNGESGAHGARSLACLLINYQV